MAGINTLISTLPPAGMSIGGLPPAVGGGGRESQGPGPTRTGLGGDTFEQGQWWKNRSQGAGDEGSSGQWREKMAVRAYGTQAANGRGPAEGATASDEAKDPSGEGGAEGKGSVSGGEVTAPNGEVLDSEEQRVVSQLRQRDVEVRAHEQAHLAAAGGYAAGGASFQYQQGPDGKKYAVGGEVPIDVSKESDPEKTISKMNVVRAAALAPADPSAQDRRIASRAASSISEAQQELATAREEEELARREEMAQRTDSAVNGQDAADSEKGAGGSVNGGMKSSVRKYGEAAASVGAGDWRGFNRAV